MHGAGCSRMPEVRAGNATVNATGAETLAAVQDAAASCRTVAAGRRGRRAHDRRALQGRWRAAGGAVRPAARTGARARYPGCPVRHRGRQGRRGLRREARLARGDRDRARDAPARCPAALAHRCPAPRRRRVRARRDAPRPARRTGWHPRARPDLLAVSDDAAAAEADRRQRDLAAAAARAGAAIEPISEAAWVGHCASLPPARVRLPGRDARVSLPGLDAAWAYDAGRRLALVPHEAATHITPRQSAPPPPATLVERVRQALTP